MNRGNNQINIVKIIFTISLYSVIIVVEMIFYNERAII